MKPPCNRIEEEQTSRADNMSQTDRKNTSRAQSGARAGEVGGDSRAHGQAGEGALNRGGQGARQAAEQRAVRRVVLMNKADCAERGLRDGDMVDIVSSFPDGERRAPDFRVVEYDHSRGGCTTYFPEANVVIPLDNAVTKSNTPVFKSTPIHLEPTGKRAEDMPPMPAGDK